jgi:hypothetical protein
MNVLTRSYDASRTGSNREETILTPKNVGSNLLLKTRSLHMNDDPRLEAQPLYVSQIKMSDGNVHDVVYVCTMANNVWAFDANTGQPIWQQPTNLGHPIRPKLTNKPNQPPTQTEIDTWGINILWGILSTPVIDLETKKLYAVAWTSPDGSGTVASAVHQLHEVDITSGQKTSNLTITASAPDQVQPGQQVPTFVPSKQKQRASLLLTTVNTTKVLFVGCGMTHEEGDPTHGWLLAFELGPLSATAAWCTSPNGSGAGIWQAGQGPAADGQGGIYVMTGNYGVKLPGGGLAPPKDGDLPESIVKLNYTPAAGGGKAKLEPVGWFTPFQDSVRNQNGADNFQDYDLGSAGPVPLPGMNLIVGAGKDGVLYVLDTDTAKFGKGSDFHKLKQIPIFFTYFPGFGIDAANVANLDHLFDGKTHHLHASPAFWVDPARGPMLFCWGENESLRAWTIDRTGTTTFVAKSAEVASAGTAGKGGMPGGFLLVTSNGGNPNTGIVWATAPISDDANKHVVDGILRAYDATALDPVTNADGTPRLKLLWDSTHIPGNTFKFSKFCPPVVADGKVLVATYEGRVDIYQLPGTAPGPLPTNANLGPGH